MKLVKEKEEPRPELPAKVYIPRSHQPSIESVCLRGRTYYTDLSDFWLDGTEVGEYVLVRKGIIREPPTEFVEIK